jgi:hypothetical protein
VRRALPIYAVAAVVLLSAGVIAHPTTRTFGGENFDFSSYVWFLAWWPKAVLAGHDSLRTTFLFAPGGYNMTWAATVPLLSVLSAPLTLLDGPIADYNALALAAPVLCATTAFVLCRYVTRARGPSIVGGAIFGFSPYVIGNEQVSALSLMYVALVPLAIWLVLRRSASDLTRRRFLGWFTALLVAEFFISPEVLATATAFGGATIIGLFAVAPAIRPRLRSLAVDLVAAYAILAALVSPWLYEMFGTPHLPPAITSVKPFSNDLLSFFIPSSPTVGAGAFTSVTRQFPGGPLSGQHGFGYLGLPLLLALALALVPQIRRSRAEPADFRLRVTGVVTAVTAVAALGPELHVAGHSVMPFPWALVSWIPGLHYALPARFAAYTALGAGVVVAIWLASRPSLARWALAGASLLFLIPSPNWSGRRLDEPAAFRDGRIARVLHRNDLVLALPVYGDQMRWQAETGFAYRLAGGYAATSFPADYLALYCNLAAPNPSPAVFSRFLASHQVTAILLPTADDPYLLRLDPAPGRLLHVGDQTVVRLRPTPAYPPRAPLLTRGGGLGDCPRSP